MSDRNDLKRDKVYCHVLFHGFRGFWSMVTFHFSWGRDEVELHGHGGRALCSHGSGCRGELLTSWQL